MTRGPGRDHEAVRQAIVAAAGRLVGSEGIDSLTFRQVAAAAEVSPGRVQHYFPDRAALVQACFEHVQDMARVRVQAVLANQGDPAPMVLVTAILRAMIPRNAEELRELRVVTMFEALTLIEPKLKGALQDGHAALRQLLTTQVSLALEGRACRDRTNPARDDPETIANTLLAATEGLAGEVLHEHLPVDEADRILGAALGWTFDVDGHDDEEVPFGR